jgi:hypothetical protein
MVKNYLVGSVRPVIKVWYSDNPKRIAADNHAASTDLEHYQNMYLISRASARKFLSGDWEEICFTSPVLDARMFQIAQWYAVREMWYKEKCNILCMGADTMFVKPTEMFGCWSDMRLFNYTDPRNHVDMKQYTDLGHYFNDDVRYFPADMDPHVWDLGERHMIDWFSHNQAHWDCGQLINNHMFWSQDIADDKRLNSIFNWMAMNIRNFDETSLAQAEQWNGCFFDSAKIVHFAGSRGPQQTVNFMSEVAVKLNLELEL